MLSPKKPLFIAGLLLSSWSGLLTAETAPDVSVNTLGQVIAARSESDRARDGARHPPRRLIFSSLKRG